MIIRLHVIAEGQTEETFVNTILTKHLRQFAIESNVSCLAPDRKRKPWARGGILDYESAKRDILLWMKTDDNPDSYFTTMLDLYGLPGSFYLGNQEENRNPYRLVGNIEQSILEDFDRHPRFIRYIQLHEFEALILADPSKFDWEFIDHGDAIAGLIAMCLEFASPEMIDDRPDFAPSKRIIKEIPEYKWKKSSSGPIIASKIGLDVIRAKCPHFNDWLSKLESLAGQRSDANVSTR